jgi:transcription-repair coupling factor (superfamily II helicase)
LLEEAVREARGDLRAAQQDWSPQINIGTSVLIPEGYVTDLSVRLGLYRRIAVLESDEEAEGFAAELIDRFGPLPVEVENLLGIVAIKRLCRLAGVEKVEAGPKGAVLQFRHNHFARPDKLVAFISKHQKLFSIRPDHRLVCRQDWAEPKARVAGVERLVKNLAALAV